MWTATGQERDGPPSTGYVTRGNPRAVPARGSNPPPYDGHPRPALVFRFRGRIG